MSKCLEKYGNEWSESANETTRNRAGSRSGMMMKHIKNDFYCALFTDLLLEEEQIALIPEAEKNKQFFLFKFESYKRFHQFEGLEFYNAYNTVEDLIDDGWTLD